MTQEIIGHIIGIIGVIVICLSYQTRNKNTLLVVQTVAVVLMCVQYLLIGAYSGFGLNVVCVIRNMVFYHRDKKILSSPVIPFIFSLILGVVSIFSWDGIHSLFIIAGLMINTVCLGLMNPQNLRKSLLLTCSLVLIYNIIEIFFFGLLMTCIFRNKNIIKIFFYS